MPATPNWNDEQRARMRALHDARKAERRAKQKAAADEEAVEVERIRKMMEAKFGEGAQFIACRRGKPPVFGRSK